MADQVAAGEEKLRATIIFRRGTTYRYTNNKWLRGIQFYQNRDTGSGAVPTLQCVNAGFPYDNGPLNIGRGGAMSHQGGIKVLCAKLNDVAVGTSVVTLASAGDAAKIKPGRWHALISSCIQLGGYPPNVMNIDYAKVLSVTGTKVALDRPVKYRHSATSWEDPTDDESFGRAWLVPWDLGGAGGAVPTDPRMTVRGAFLNINLAANPNGDDITYLEHHIDASFENCSLTNPQVTMSQHVLFKNCTITRGGEPDKMMETLIFDGGTTGELGGGTGAQYWLSRNVRHGCIQVSPRQFRSLNTIHDATGDTYLTVPFSLAHNGPCLLYDFEGSTFKSNGSTNNWIWKNPPYSPIRIGIDATWQGNRLIIPRSFAQFEDWMIALFEGAVVSTTGKPQPASWGYVQTLSSPGDGSAIWVDIVWVTGAKPASGSIYPNGRFHRLLFGASNVFVAPCGWEEPGFMKETIPTAFGPSYDFPPGYPLQFRH